MHGLQDRHHILLSRSQSCTVNELYEHHCAFPVSFCTLCNLTSASCFALSDVFSLLSVLYIQSTPASQQKNPGRRHACALSSESLAIRRGRGKRAVSWIKEGDGLDSRFEFRDDVWKVVFISVDAADGFVAEDLLCRGILGTEIWRFG